MPVIKNFLPLINMTSCKIPLIFFLSINKSFGFLNKIFLLVNDESNFLTKKSISKLSVENKLKQLFEKNLSKLYKIN